MANLYPPASMLKFLLRFLRKARTCPILPCNFPPLLLYRPLVRNRPNSSGRLGVANQFSTASLARSGQSIFPIGRLDCSIAFVSIRGRDLLSSRSLPRRRVDARSEEHTSELQSRGHLVCRLLLEKKKDNATI